MAFMLLRMHTNMSYQISLSMDQVLKAKYLGKRFWDDLYTWLKFLRLKIYDSKCDTLF